MEFLIAIVILAVAAYLFSMITVKKDKLVNCKKQKELKNLVKVIIADEEYVARFENGRVYSITDNCKECLIGYYNLELASIVVRCAYDKGEIARIEQDGSAAYIILSRNGDLLRYKQTLMMIAKEGKTSQEEVEQKYNDNVSKIQVNWLCAESYLHEIEDYETGIIIAKSDSSDFIGAAAAFVCLQYEVVKYGKYKDFYKPIK